MQNSQAVSAFSALAEETRLNILRHLVSCGPEGAPAGDIAKAVGSSPSRLSFHMAKLEQAGLVRSERQARKIIYAVAFDGIGALITFLMEDCCKSSPKLRDCCRF